VTPSYTGTTTLIVCAIVLSSCVDKTTAEAV
jgi:hypothetical protein